ncbi:MAG: ABC transporter permease [Actinobacteria bacterium]|nr:MAG: ABC transporter permease [Actinomycetota bacterium]
MPLVGASAAAPGAAIILLLVLVAALAPVIAPHDPNATDLANTLVGSTGSHPLGTDASGRDILSRLIFGARTSLLGPLLVVALSTLAGVPLGLLAGYKGGAVDGLLARAWDVLFAFPPLLLAIVIVATFGAGFWTATLAISVIYLPLLARVVRGVVLVEREKAYVDACKVQGFGGLRVSLQHVLPNVAPTIVAQATLNFGYALLDLAGLAFLGLGVQPPTADWGQMLSSGRDTLVLHSYYEVVAASIAIAVTVVAFNLLGDALSARAGRSR